MSIAKGLMQLNGRTAVVTGAGSGIGRAISVSLAKRGCNLALADINLEGLEETAALIGNSVRVSRHPVDVADKDAVAAFPEQVRVAHGGADIVVNNAGVALGGGFEQTAEEDFDWLFNINFWGVVRMSRAFLPLLRESPDARLVNLSSIFGIVATPGQTAYAASKFAVRGFSEALRHELVKSSVGVTVVHPGGVATSIAKSARVSSTISERDAERFKRATQAMLKLPPETAGEIIVQGIERRRARILVGSDAKALSLMERLFPVTYWDKVKSNFRR